MARVAYEQTTCRYEGAPRPAVEKLSLEVRDGELLVLVGPSGSGKSTALRMLAGLEPVSEGTVRIGELDVTRKEPAERDVAMVFQNYALYPHMTVAENMAFALKLAGYGEAERSERVHRAARMLGLEQLLERKPKQLSGGQRQRVAMGRAIVREPQVFLMDEPLSNLDAKLRAQTRLEVAQLQRRLGTTTMYVTHDQVEAMTLGDRVAVMESGKLQQCAPPSELYAKPANVFVAGFIGSPAMNLLDVPRVGAAAARLGDALVPVPPNGGHPYVTLGLRPEALEPAADGALPFSVEVVEALGADAYAYGRLAGVDEQLVVRCDGRMPPRRGETLRLRVREDEVHAFDPTTGLRLGPG
mgnify:CR=1 FL=1